jgi:hypothetical protein
MFGETAANSSLPFVTTMKVDVTRRVEVAHGERTDEVHPDEVLLWSSLGRAHQQFIEAKVRRERAGLLLDGGVEDF